jgi:hypothetical protein
MLSGYLIIARVGPREISKKTKRYGVMRGKTLRTHLSLDFNGHTPLHGLSLHISQYFVRDSDPRPERMLEKVRGRLLAQTPFLHPDEMKKVHWDVVRSWIRTCDLEHGDTCAKHRSNHICLPGFQVIDCNTRRVVAAPTNCAYAALSYVWGSSNTTEELTQAPLVIEDAITCTLALNLPYLWGTQRL